MFGFWKSAKTSGTSPEPLATEIVKVETVTETLLMVQDATFRQNKQYLLSLANDPNSPTNGLGSNKSPLDKLANDISHNGILNSEPQSPTSPPSLLLVRTPAPTRYPIIFSPFTFGLIAGQFSVIFVMILCIRYFIFSGSPQDKRDYQSHIRKQRQAKLLPDQEATCKTILEKTYYDVNSHPPESLDWFTVLVAQGLFQLRDDAKHYDNLLNTISKMLNSDSIPSYIDEIFVTELNVGNDFPTFSNCRIIAKDKEDEELCSDEEIDPSELSRSSSVYSRPHVPPQAIRSSRRRSQSFSTYNKRKKFHSSNEASFVKDIEDDNMELEALVDVDLSDTITLGINTRLLLNFPRPKFAAVPISLTVSIVRFSGTLKISLHKPEPDFDMFTDSDEFDQEHGNAYGRNTSSEHFVDSNTNNMETEVVEPTNPEIIQDPENSYSKLADSVGNPSSPDLDTAFETYPEEPQKAPSTAKDTSAEQNKNSKNSKKNKSYLTVSFEQGPYLEFDIKSSVGGTSVLKDVPKVADIVENLLRNMFQRYFVYPNEKRIYLPTIWPQPDDDRNNTDANKQKGGSNTSNNSKGNNFKGQHHHAYPESNEGSVIINSLNGQQVASSPNEYETQQQQYASRTHTPRLHPRSCSSVSQLASNTAIIPSFRNLADTQDDSAII